MNYTKALEVGIISKLEFNRLKNAARMRNEAIQVDDFSFEEYYKRVEAAPCELRKKAI